MLTNEEVIAELLKMAKEINNARKEGDDLGLTEEEMAFYDALTKQEAIHGHDHNGVTYWENAPDGKIVKSDVSIAKNYLTEKEMNFMERIVTYEMSHRPVNVKVRLPLVVFRNPDMDDKMV